VMLASLSLESTLEAVPSKRDKRPVEVEWSLVDELLV
jgi:hypothetical protein